MEGEVNNLNDRLKWAVIHGDADECRRLTALGAGLSASVSSSDQADWMLAAIRAPAAQAEILALPLNAGFDPNSVYTRIGAEYQQTPFVAAAAAARLDLMLMLVKAGADIHWHSPTGANAASEAMPCRACQAVRRDSAERAEVCAWRASHGVRLDPYCQDSRRKLAWAASNPDSWPDVGLLVEKGVDAACLEWTPFMHRIATGEATVADAASLSGEELECCDCYKRTPFLMAVAAGRKDLAEAWLLRGADLFASGWCGATAMHLAAEYDLPEMIEWLARQDFPVDVPDDFQQMPLRRAVSRSLRAARVLLALGADVNAADDNGYQHIHDTTSREMLELLLNAGADVNAISGGGCWPLKNVCDTGDPAHVQFLLDHGAKPDLTSTGETALFSAVRSDSLECVRLLLDAGAEVNALDVDGWTCLWNVCSVPMAELLLHRGADPSIGDCSGLPEDWSLPLEVSATLRAARLAAR